MDSPYAFWMDRYAVAFPHMATLKDAQDELANVLQKRGLAHEHQLENSFIEQGLSLVKIAGQNDTEKKDATLSAMKQGIDVIAQARLDVDDFMGYADFLIKVDGASDLGDFHYEVWDTKLSKHLKPSYVIQLCCYAEMLEAMQGVRPQNIALVLGNGKRERLRTHEYFQYYLELKKSFLSALNTFEMPDPAEYKEWGSWSTYAEQVLKEKDHLFQIANIKRSQIKKLNKSDIFTMQGLVDTKLQRIPGLNDAIFKSLQKQADIQKKSQGQLKPLYQVIVPEEGARQGLALLPPASPLDVFFDIEGFPLHEDGLEYLWGCTYFNDSGERSFIDFWAHDHEEEKLAFQNFIHWVYGRWQKDPSMHIYHYANYEIAACRKLMGRFGVCEEELDALLRNEVFVDLYKIVKGGLLLGEPRYSIKNVERLYRDKRNTEVGSGGDSVVVYEKWRELHELGEEGRTWQDSETLKSIRDYNIDDCNSTQELVDWLRPLQKEHNITYLGKTEIETPEVKEDITERTQLRDRFLEKAIQSSDPKQAQLLTNLAGVLEFHKREDKPAHWRYFDRIGQSQEELLDDADCLALCERTSRAPFKLTPRTKNLSFEYRFDPTQEFKEAKDTFYLLGEENAKGRGVKVEYVSHESDLENGIIVLKSNMEPKALISLIPDEIVPAKPIPESITAFVKKYEMGNQRSAIIEFLNRSKPLIKGHKDGPIILDNGQDKLTQIIQAVENLDHSYLTIQGPPGAGKSYTAKHIIAKLVQSGLKIGISSNSHKAINNLLLLTARYCNTENIKASFVCTKDTEAALTQECIVITDKADLANHVKSACVLGTTTWGFAREDMADQLDYLFIDEAGQVSVANLIAMSRSAKNLVLMGDQMQLAQPTKGTHPAESGLSILDYLLHNSPTISDSMGIFLGTTYRMHPNVNRFISEHIYDSKLKSHPDTAHRIIKVPSGYQGPLNKEAGILFIPVHHEGNTQASTEEVAEIKQLALELLGRTLITSDGLERKVIWDDMMFVAPYNYQCRKLKEALGPQAKVGSVDKFQGQEAAIVFLSMCASDASECPRGMDFLLSKNRVNVAISRAQSLAIVVGNPNLGNARVNHVHEMKMVNLFTALCAKK